LDTGSRRNHLFSRYYILYRDRGEDWIQVQVEIIYSPGTIYYTEIEEKIGYRFREKSFILQALYTIQT